MDEQDSVLRYLNDLVLAESSSVAKPSVNAVELKSCERKDTVESRHHALQQSAGVDAINIFSRDNVCMHALTRRCALGESVSCLNSTADVCNQVVRDSIANAVERSKHTDPSNLEYAWQDVEESIKAVSKHIGQMRSDPEGELSTAKRAIRIRPEDCDLLVYAMDMALSELSDALLLESKMSQVLTKENQDLKQKLLRAQAQLGGRHQESRVPLVYAYPQGQNAYLHVMDRRRDHTPKYGQLR